MVYRDNHTGMQDDVAGFCDEGSRDPSLTRNATSTLLTVPIPSRQHDGFRLALRAFEIAVGLHG